MADSQQPYVANFVEQPGFPATSFPPVLAGGLCPKCGKGKLDYNGVLDLDRPVCGYTSNGGVGYT
jgi:uncharacterized protein (DUF983 family)